LRFRLREVAPDFAPEEIAEIAEKLRQGDSATLGRLSSRVGHCHDDPDPDRTVRQAPPVEAG
jgi:hypothetical protein